MEFQTQEREGKEVTFVPPVQEFPGYKLSFLSSQQQFPSSSHLFEDTS